ncbi:hypothetical protein RB595_008163 [Gaeumannomyces hyphopodioides]
MLDVFGAQARRAPEGGRDGGGFRLIPLIKTQYRHSFLYEYPPSKEHPQTSANQPIGMSQTSEALFRLSHESVQGSEPSVMLDRYIRTQSSSALSALATTGVGRSGEERKAAMSEQLAQLQAALDAKGTEDSA